MRKKFEVQYEMGVTPIEKIEMPKRSRDEIPAVLRALQYIYMTPCLNAQVFEALEKHINKNKKKTGRPGMHLWSVLVLGVVRNARGADYDHLQQLANYDRLVRGIMGVETAWGLEKKQFSLQTIRDNVDLITEEIISELNRIVVASGHEVKGLKKKDHSVKVDSYVVESTVHFPTDYNLLWDAARKICDLIEKIGSEKAVKGWRKLSSIRKEIKSGYTRMCRSSKGGGKSKSERKKAAAIHYLKKARFLSDKLRSSKLDILHHAGIYMKNIEFLSLEWFHQMLDKHIDLLERRAVNSETIPHEEKMFSLFETYTEWINKGKSGNRVELGLNVVIGTDESGFILEHQVLEDGLRDATVAVSFSENLLENWDVKSLSFDKGFWSRDNYLRLVSQVETLVMPKKGKQTKAEKERESAKVFCKLRDEHAAVESDINALEHHGLDRCPDKGIKNFKRYVGFSVLAMNLHRLGNALRVREKRAEELKAA